MLPNGKITRQFFDMHHDDYLSCSEYQSQPSHSEKGFVAFYREDLEKFFFALLSTDGSVLLKSEGYPQEKSRDKGIQSVITNARNPDRYVVMEEGGRFYISLRAGNRKEIAQSCDFKTRAEAEGFIASIVNYDAAPVVKAAAKVAVADTAKADTAKAAAKVTASAAAPVAEVKKAKAENKKVSATQIETSVVETPVLVDRADDYLFASEYLGHPNLWINGNPTGYAMFEHENGQYYFAVYNPDGSLYLRSEGFTTTDLREEEFNAVVRHIENGDSYKTKEVFGKFVNILFDENNCEVARSAYFDTFAEAFAHTPFGRLKSEAVMF